MKKRLILALCILLMIPATILQAKENSDTDKTGLYLSQLDSLETAIYQALEDQKLTPENNSVTITRSYLDEEELDEIWMEYYNHYEVALYAYQRDHVEELMWGSDEIFLDANINENTIDIILGFTVSEYYNEQLGKQTTNTILQVVENCKQSSRYLKVKYYHDYIVNSCEYDYENEYEYYGSEVYYYDHSLVGCIVQGKGICEGYARAMKVFMDYESIPCLIVTSDDHAFNYIMMEDGNWYMVDCTWDDPVNAQGYYDTYLLVSNEPNIDAMHTVDTTFIYPSTATIDYSTPMLFEDVVEGKWYYDYIARVNQLGLMTGTSKTEFMPSASMTRGMVATVLYRMAGSLEVEYNAYFEDVPNGKYYSKAITWCYQNGIVKGKGNNLFAPSSNITRQELCIMLRNYASYCGKDISSNNSILSNYPDRTTVSNYAKESVAWAIEHGLISGDQGKINPKKTATRAQCAKMLLATYDFIMNRH